MTITATAAETADYASASSSYRLTIAPKKLTITADDKSTYAGNQMPTLTYTVDGLVGDDTVSVELSCDANMNHAGETPIVVTASDGSGNYQINPVNGTLTVMPLPTITTLPMASAITYGDKLEDSQLSGGKATMEGTFAWDDPSIEPSVSDSNKTEYTVVFTATAAQ